MYLYVKWWIIAFAKWPLKLLYFFNLQYIMHQLDDKIRLPSLCLSLESRSADNELKAVVNAWDKQSLCHHLHQKVTTTFTRPVFHNWKLCCSIKKDSFTLKVLEIYFVFFHVWYKTLRLCPRNVLYHPWKKDKVLF